MKDHQASHKNISEIEFRISFRDEYGIDYLEAKKKVIDMQKETERRWNEVLVKNKLK